jgi:UDP-3-O-[3-hydroxymyristoyl] glucosamine N-acyltransferase
MTSSPSCSVSAERGCSAGELAAWFDGELTGDSERRGFGLAPVARACERDIVFVANERHLAALADSGAGIVLMGLGMAPLDPSDLSCRSYVRVANPHACFARLSTLLGSRRRFVPGIESGAMIHPEAEVHPTARVCSGAWVGAGSRIGPEVYLGTGVFIGERVDIGAQGYFHPGCRILDEVRIGSEVIVYPGAVIGGDGFGFAQDRGEWIKVEQLGTVIIGDRVEIGANSTVDRGALDDTVIGDGVKIDNLVHVAHNVTIGAHTAIAGCVGIAGSAHIGRHCAIGGGAGILGHLEIADHVTVLAMTLVTRSIREPGRYASGVPHQEAHEWNRSLARLRRLGRNER